MCVLRPWFWRGCEYVLGKWSCEEGFIGLSLITVCRFIWIVALFGMLGTLFMVGESENGSMVEGQRKMIGER